MAARNRVRRIDAATGVISTYAGTGVGGFQGDGGPATAARFSFIAGLAFDANDNLYVSDQNNRRIRKVEAATGLISTFAGTGLGFPFNEDVPALEANLNSPVQLFLQGDWLYITQNSFGSCRIYKVNLQTGGLHFVAGRSGSPPSNLPSTATDVIFQPTTSLVVDAGHNVYYAMDGGAGVARIDAATGVVARTPGYFEKARGLAWDGPDHLIVSEWTGRKVVRLTLATGETTVVAGTGVNGFRGDGGPATAARFGKLEQVTRDECGNLLIADAENGRIRRVDARTGIVSTAVGIGVTGPAGESLLRYLGDGGPAVQAAINFTRGLTLGDDGEFFLADFANGRVRRVENLVPVADAGRDQTLECTSPDGAVATLSGADSADGDNDPLAFTWSEGATALGAGVSIAPTLALGSHTVTVVAADNWCAESADEVDVEVLDTTPPALADVDVSRDRLWPPNHEMRLIEIDWTASDVCLPFEVTLEVGSDDPGDGAGDGNTASDWEIIDNRHVRLRAERAGHDGDRTYWIAVTATDTAGNAHTEVVTVVVPHDMGN